MIFPHLHCFPTVTSKCPKGRFVALGLKWVIETKLCIDLIIDKIYIGNVKDHFLQSCITVTEYIFFL